MAKRNSNGASKRRPALRRDESTWTRSMESLGRMIGSLQRELDSAADAALRRRSKPARGGRSGRKGS